MRNVVVRRCRPLSTPWLRIVWAEADDVGITNVLDRFTHWKPWDERTSATENVGVAHVARHAYENRTTRNTHAAVRPVQVDECLSGKKVGCGGGI
jgi:hypothetical protein